MDSFEGEKNDMLSIFTKYPNGYMISVVVVSLVYSHSPFLRHTLV